MPEEIKLSGGAPFAPPEGTGTTGVGSGVPVPVPVPVIPVPDPEAEDEPAGNVEVGDAPALGAAELVVRGAPGAADAG